MSYEHITRIKCDHENCDETVEVESSARVYKDCNLYGDTYETAEIDFYMPKDWIRPNNGYYCYCPMHANESSK